MRESLPNITASWKRLSDAGALRTIFQKEDELTGAFYKVDETTKYRTLSSTEGTYADGSFMYFTASRCSDIYGRSSKVTPLSLKAYFYIRF